MNLLTESQDHHECERCEELGHDKARYFRLYEQACIELQAIKNQTPVARISITYTEIDGEKIEVISCDLGVGIHNLYRNPSGALKKT